MAVRCGIGASGGGAGDPRSSGFRPPSLRRTEAPRLGNYAHAHTLRWAEAVGRNDAFVVVTPEYNHMPPSSLVNAVTFLGPEWGFKPVAIASYGECPAGCVPRSN
ncbi:NADPH-dependent FMN reductase [Seohaeicola zhoushanensis]